MVRVAHVFAWTFVLVPVLLLAFFSEGGHAGSRYQIQIGSAKNLEGTRYFTRKASTVLAMPAYIIKLGQYYTVLVGDYGTREQAVKELQRIKKHYNGMVVSYEIRDALGAFEDGQEINADAVASLPQAVKRPDRKKTIRKVDKSELAGLDQTLEGNLDNIIVEGCRLSNEETLSEYLFSTTCKFAELDPEAITIEEKYGNNIYVHVDSLHKRPVVTIKQTKDGKVTFARKDAQLVLRSKIKDKKALSKTVQALHDIILYCSQK